MGSVDGVKSWSVGSFASVSVQWPTFAGAPQNVLVNVSVCRSQKALFPSEARELAKALEEAAKAAEKAQAEYDQRLEDKIRAQRDLEDRLDALEKWKETPKSVAVNYHFVDANKMVPQETETGPTLGPEVASGR